MNLDDWNEKYQRVERDYQDYMIILDIESKKREVCGPHCDRLVLHEPGICWACDLFPALHAARREMKIAFTGHKPLPDERPCPAEVMRPVDTIHRWYGNYPHQEIGGEDD